METHTCPKCNESMDEGMLSMSGNMYLGYITTNQKGMMKVQTQITQARACPNCGYVEMYLDPKELKSRIS